MSLESDVSYSVKSLVDTIKATVNSNLKKAVQNGQLTLEEEKIVGVSLLVQNSIDQAFIEGSDLLTNTLRAHSKNK
tara:strand:+ start:13 stop:240 length:228 start_codon:yes stop_codon:yes gene_type:complete